MSLLQVLWGASGIGLRSFLPVGISPLLDALQSQRSRLALMPLSMLGSIRILVFASPIPPICIFLLRRIPLVVALREPLAVATSLHARNGFSLNRGLVLWWIYNHHIASQLCSKDLLVPYRNCLLSG